MRSPTIPGSGRVLHSTQKKNDQRVLTIEAGRRYQDYWSDLWRYRELFLFLTWRDIAVRYKQTMLGVGWAVFQPLVSMIVLTFVFGYLAGLRDDTSVPYPLLVLSGFLPWHFFVSVLNASSSSLVSSSRLITRVYFPRLMIPMSVVGVSLIDFLISFSLFFVLAGFFWISGYENIDVLSLRLIMIPFFLIMAALAALSIGIWFATLNVKYRDFRIIVPFVVQFGVFLTPVGYSSSVAGDYPLLLWLNPMAMVVDGFRWCLLGTETNLNPAGFLIATFIIGALLFGGVTYFRKVENRMADVV